MADIELKIEQETLFVGAYTPVVVGIDPNTGWTMDDLQFSVGSGLAGGLISTAREREADLERPTVMLLAGFEPGTHVVEVSVGGSLVGEAKFEVVGTWTDEKTGPPLWFSGRPDAGLAGAAWGGGPVGPQNVGISPQLGTRRIAILLVDTSSERYTTDASTLQGHRDRWMNELITGVTASGQTRSTRAFYQEVSYGGLDLSAQVFGPVSLTDNWDTYFNADGTPKGSYFQAAITAGDGLIDYSQTDTVLCVSQSVLDDGGAVTNSAWPYASIGRWGPYTTSDGNLNLGVASMPNDWGVIGNREIHETFAHELGHNLGLGDQYAPAVSGRNPGGWEMMHDDDSFPHFSVAHRMMLGWIQPAWVRSFNFATAGAPLDQTVELHAIERGAPPAGRSSAVEVRIGDGLNYYFEYRNGEAPQIGDRSLPSDNRVLGTDVASPPFVAPFSRPAVLLLPADGDDDGTVLDNGDFYKELDASPFPVEFRADVSGIDGTSADLRIRYGANGRPDPSIRPWPASPSRPWQSPDIEVRNAKNAADSSWANVPWVGNPNTVVAKVKNGGTVLAPQVRVNFYVKDYTVGGAPEVFLGWDVRNVAAGATVEFTTNWVPPTSGHYCVVVRIPLYIDPNVPTIVEMTELNNTAQSNYDRFNTATSSPSTREHTRVAVGNPYEKATRVWLIGQQSNPLYRTYVEHTWLLLEPGEVQQVAVMLEHTLDPKRPDVIPEDARPFERQIEKYLRSPNSVGLHAYAEDPTDEPRHALELMGGAGLMVTTGRGTKIDNFGNDGPVISGNVVTTDDAQSVPGGMVVVTVTEAPDKPEQFVTLSAAVQDGAFRVLVSNRQKISLRRQAADIGKLGPIDRMKNPERFRPSAPWSVMRVEYLGTPGFAPCEEDWTKRRD
ncbi:M6 family metalloprotease-like protein [Okibacterium sp. HSC-33S16]|uniref:CARDB domain-containing protein n=1 Tax=Okibacterium sp. HSC-33S16 TaxID=2910965 RepID=UPI0020A0A622|nr:CARDB domain-containing protein [Okibacterium sp. HSC-33S16]MCP2032850.1 M6 family metalloprotease-like protein [Okibacterium sp. HSC-33S16]